MAPPIIPGRRQAKILNPLWIISLFLGIAQVTVGVATTQATGWIQGLLAIFSVAFPILVSSAFFTILWKKPYVLYAPGDFPESGPGVIEFRQAMSTSSGPRTDEIEDIVRTVVTEVLITTPEIEDSARGGVVNRAVDIAREEVIQRSLDIDISAFTRKNGGHLAILYQPELPTGRFLDEIWYSISSQVEAFSYGRSWMLRDKQTGQVYANMGRDWARANLSANYDIRPLSEVGISQKSLLEVMRIN